MASLLAVLALAAALVPAPLPSREYTIAYIVVPDLPPDNFDLYDVRAEMNEPPQYAEVQKRSIFGIKHHVGFGGGYDQGIVHASIGFYVTVAEWGRWNFGATSPALGFGRYPVYDARQKKYQQQVQSTILVSLASVHFRGGYLRSIDKVWYLNFEQIYDPRANLNGTQFGISLANR